jgi:hypothetical protein
MRGAVSQLPQYAFIAWCSVKNTGITLTLPLPKGLKMFDSLQLIQENLKIQYR